MTDRNRKTSAEWDEVVSSLKLKLETAKKEARKMRKLEECKEAELRRQEEIRYALAFVRFSKTITFNNSGRSFYDVIAERLAGADASDAVSL